MDTTDTPWLTPDEQHLWRAWLDAGHGIARAVEQGLQEDGLSTPDYEVLVHLSEGPTDGFRVTQFADLLGWERSRLSHHLARMEKRDLVSRCSCSEDARGQIVRITPAGRDRIAAVAPAHVRTVRAAFVDLLDDTDRADLQRILDRVIARRDRTP